MTNLFRNIHFFKNWPRKHSIFILYTVLCNSLSPPQHMYSIMCMRILCLSVSLSASLCRAVCCPMNNVYYRQTCPPATYLPSPPPSPSPSPTNHLTPPAHCIHPSALHTSYYHMKTFSNPFVLKIRIDET